MTWDELIDNLIDGQSESAWTEIFHRFKPFVGTIIAKTIRDQSVVDDLIQEVFLDVHQCVPKLQNRDEDIFKKWLTTIALRKRYNCLRKQKKTPVHIAIEDDIVQQPSNDDKDEFVKLLKDFIKSLPEEEVPYAEELQHEDCFAKIARTLDEDYAKTRRICLKILDRARMHFKSLGIDFVGDDSE